MNKRDEQARLARFEEALDALTKGLRSADAAKVLARAAEMVEGALSGADDAHEYE